MPKTHAKKLTSCRSNNPFWNGIWFTQREGVQLICLLNNIIIQLLKVQVWICFTIFQFLFQLGINKGTVPTDAGITLTTQRFYFLHRYSGDLFLDQPDGFTIERRHLGGNYYPIHFYDGSVVIRYAYEEEARTCQRNSVDSGDEAPTRHRSRWTSTFMKVVHLPCNLSFSWEFEDTISFETSMGMYNP